MRHACIGTNRMHIRNDSAFYAAFFVVDDMTGSNLLGNLHIGEEHEMPFGHRIAATDFIVDETAGAAVYTAHLPEIWESVRNFVAEMELCAAE